MKNQSAQCLKSRQVVKRNESILQILILEHRIGVDLVINEHRSAENHGDQARKVERSTAPIIHALIVRYTDDRSTV